MDKEELSRKLDRLNDLIFEANNIIKELNDKAEKGYQNSNKHSKTLLLQNYMMSKIL